MSYGKTSDARPNQLHQLSLEAYNIKFRCVQKIRDDISITCSNLADITIILFYFLFSHIYTFLNNIFWTYFLVEDTCMKKKSICSSFRPQKYNVFKIMHSYFSNYFFKSCIEVVIVVGDFTILSNLFFIKNFISYSKEIFIEIFPSVDHEIEMLPRQIL